MPGTKRTASGVVGGLLGLVGLSAVAGLLITATVTPAIAVSGMAAKSSITLFDNLPSNLEIDKVMMPTTFYAKDENGNDKVMARFYEQNRSPVTLTQVAPVMIDAILSSEDDRFYSHGGVDLQGTTRALFGQITKTGSGGGSSLSQQYVKNVLTQQCEYGTTTEDAKLECWRKFTTPDGTEGLTRKVQEMRYAIALEKKYSKEDILLGYLNIAAFGGVNYGVDAAARYYFGVDSAHLNLGQAATLAGMVQSPDNFRLDRPDNEANGAANGYALTKARRDTVLYNMNKDGKITEDAYHAALEAPITPNLSPQPTGCAAAVGAEYFCQFVKQVMLSDSVFGETLDERQRSMNRDGLSVYTTMDARLQASATNTMDAQLPDKIEGMKFGAATANIEVNTGRILAITQNTRFSENPDVIKTDPLAYSSQVYASDQKYGDPSIGFEVGSTFKMFTLVEWLEQGHSLREGLNGRKNQEFKGKICGDQTWSYDEPGNFNNNAGYGGTPMQFTRDSLNSGFIAMASKLQLCDIADVANRMGAHIGNNTPVKLDVPFQTLGSPNLSPITMASVYATVANQGKACTPHAIDRIVGADKQERKLPAASCTQAISPEVANTAAYALQGVMEGGGTGVRGNPFNGSAVIGKTGTHEQRQTWLVETSTRVATAAWVGNSEGSADLQDQGLENYRYDLARDVQGAANNFYPAPDFPGPDSNLNKLILTELPDVTGMTTSDATRTLEEKGFSVIVGEPVNGSEAPGIITKQDPGAGQVNSGTAVTIYPSNGKGARVPDVRGMSKQDAAAKLVSEGFTNYGSTCDDDKNAKDDPIATGTEPSAGSKADPGDRIVIKLKAKKC